MNAETENQLWSAYETLGKCAGSIIKKKPAGGQLTAEQQDLLIAFGTSQDWLKWAGSLKSLQLKNRHVQKSPRVEGVAESVRFTQMWTGTNALFACDSILRLLTTRKLPTQEGQRFRLLYSSATINNQLETACLKNLHALLGMECKTDGLKPTLGLKYTYPTMWEVIHHKYSRAEDYKRGIGKVIAEALAKHQLPVVDGPTLIYGARNWTVHGVLLTSFFRGSPQKYLTFINNIELLLAATLNGAATSIYPKL